MNREEFFKLIKNKCAFENSDNIHINSILEDIEDWDSLAVINVLSIFKSVFNFMPQTEQLKSCKTFEDILNLAGDKYEE